MPFCSECGSRRKLNQNKVCNECSGGDIEETTEERGDDFWTKMDSMFDKKLESFEEKLNANIKEEVKKATDPIKVQLAKLETENKNLKAEMTALKANQKEEKTKSDKIVKVLKEQQITLSRSDKNARFKRLLLSGVSEGTITINEEQCVSDEAKIKGIFETLKVEDVKLVGFRRLGNKDQGVDQRPRFILLEFLSSADRNKVKKESEKLKNRDDTKNFFRKADKTKKERDEYKRLYKVKEQLEKDEPNKKIEINYGKLLIDGTPVDKIDTANDFLS